MKIAIIGYGFVGKALENGLTDSVNVYKVDPKLGTQIIDLIDFKPNAIFICLPTPMKDDLSQDISIVLKALDELNKIDLGSLVVLKSTVLPNYIKEIKDSSPNIIYNPEFLRENHSSDDFINSNLIVFGGGENSTKLLANIYKNYTKCLCKEYIYTDLVTASFVKYTINSYLATKVTFFNELNQLFGEAEALESWDNFTSIISRDPRIGKSHMKVPGPDGRFGFGGSCFPKDTNAFSSYADSLRKPLNVLKKAIKTNNKIRAGYNSVTERESEQNISFKGDV